MELSLHLNLIVVENPGSVNFELRADQVVPFHLKSHFDSLPHCVVYSGQAALVADRQHVLSTPSTDRRVLVLIMTCQ